MPVGKGMPQVMRAEVFDSRALQGRPPRFGGTLVIKLQITMRPDLSLVQGEEVAAVWIEAKSVTNLSQHQAAIKTCLFSKLFLPGAM
jgi:hypothetical protein